jgi:hypothetical protein
MTTAWHDLQHEPITWEMFLDIAEEIRRDLEIVDGYVVPREQRGREHGCGHDRTPRASRRGRPVRARGNIPPGHGANGGQDL